MTNFVVGKIGLPIRFNWLDYKSNFFSPADDISRLIVNLSFNNPSDSFYIIGKNDTPYFLEVNTLPGMTKTSLFPKSLDSAGLDFSSLVSKIIDLSL